MRLIFPRINGPIVSLNDPHIPLIFSKQKRLRDVDSCIAQYLSNLFHSNVRMLAL